MKKNNGWIYFVVGFILVIAFAIIVNNNNNDVVEEKTNFKEITLTYFLEELQSEDVYLYLGYPECPFCQQLEPLLLQVQNELKKDINYINTNAMSDLEKSKLPEIHDIFKGKWGTPVLLNVSKGQVVDYNMGLVDINTLRTFYNLETKEEESLLEEITLTYFLEELEKEDVYLYLGYPECPYCQQLEPLLLQVQNELKKDINYINTNAMSDLEKSKLPEIHDIFKGEWGTPVLLNVSKGQVVDYNMGLVDINTLRTFYNLETKEEESLLEEINFTEFKELIKSEERQIVFFGYPECPYCQKTKPILEEISEEEGLDIKYININNFDKTIVTELSELSEAFEGEWGVPLIITAKDGQVLKYISGLREKSVFLNFFDEE